MDETGPSEEATLFPKAAGERLRDARLAMGLDLPELAARTRIRERYLEAIETGDYSAIQSPTYAVGFAKSYARAVGLSEVDIAAEVRRATQGAARAPEYQPYEMEDPARLPSRGLAIGAVLLGLALLAGIVLWYGTNLFRGDGSVAPAPTAEPSFAPDTPVATPTPDAATGQVTLVATDEVWLRVYDAAGTTLLQKTMMPGERYDVPGDANGPMINVGRPDKLQVLVNGAEVAPLGDGRVAIKDVGIGAAALAARNAPQPAPSATATVAAPAAPQPIATRSQPQQVPPYFRQPEAARPTSRSLPPARPYNPPAAREPAAPAPEPAPGNSAAP